MRTTVILLHGAGSNHRTFDDVVARLAGVDVRALSYPGRCGEPGTPLRDIEELINWCDSRLERMELERVMLVGHSLGTAVAVGVTQRRVAHGHSHITSLLLMATPTRPPAVRAIASLWQQAAARGDVASIRGMAFLPGTAADTRARALANEDLTPPEAVAADWQVALSIGERTPPPLPVPIHFVVGGMDKLGPEHDVRRWADVLPRASLDVWPQAGHRMDVEEPDRVAQVIRQQLDVM